MKGFTLIETLIYSVILVIVLGGIFVTFYSIMTTSESLKYQIELVENTKFLEQKFRWALTGAEGVTMPAVGSASSHTLAINRPGVANPLVFDLDNGIVRVASGSNTPVPLTNGFVTVSTISFETFSFSSNTQNTVRIKAELENLYEIAPATTSLDLFITIQ
jgi:type II secretory pathway component PulJ